MVLFSGSYKEKTFSPLTAENSFKYPTIFSSWNDTPSSLDFEKFFLFLLDFGRKYENLFLPPFFPSLSFFLLLFGPLEILITAKYICYLATFTWLRPIFAGKKVELSFLAIVPMNRTTFYKSNRGYFFTLLLSRLYLHPRRNVIKTASSKIC